MKRCPHEMLFVLGLQPSHNYGATFRLVILTIIQRLFLKFIR